MGALYIVAGMVLVGIVVLFAIYYSRPMKMTSYTDGEITGAVEQVVRDERERREQTVITCRYVVRGKPYTIDYTVRGKNAARYPKGRVLKVRYNPNIPNMARVTEE